MKFRADAAIDHIGQSFTIVHEHLILLLEALNLGARYILCHGLVPYGHQVIHFWDGLGCLTHGKQVHFRAQTDELDDRIALNLVLELAHFSCV